MRRTMFTGRVRALLVAGALLAVLGAGCGGAPPAGGEIALATDPPPPTPSSLPTLTSTPPPTAPPPPPRLKRRLQPRRPRLRAACARPMTTNW